MFVLFAVFELIFIDSIWFLLNFPMLITKTSAIVTTSSSSSASSAMKGDPPIASTAFAQSFIVTEFVMQCVNAFFSRMFFNVLSIRLSKLVSSFVMIVNYNFILI